ncbi:MAG TPA: extracellular solute-binding protein [Devosiaceae bacterium]|jgi:iron(III) transport system substrate-binding protein
MTIRKSLASLGCAIALFAVTGSAFAQTAMSDADMAALVTAAQAEGQVVIYSGASSDQLDRYAKGFTDAYGIQVQVVRLTGAQTTQRFATEAAAGTQQADVLGTSENSYFDSNPTWFMDLSKTNLPNYVKWPADAKSNYRTIITRGILGLLYNSDLVKEADAPKVWKDVVDPKWKGQIILSDPQLSVNWGGWLKVTSDTLGAPFIEALAGQNFQVVASTATGAQQAAAGAKALNFPTASSFALALQAQGAPIKYVFMAEPTITNRFNFGAAAAAPHPNAAKLFMNWLLSDKGITATCTDYQVMSPGDPSGSLGCMAKPAGDLVEIPDGLDEQEMTKLFDLLKLK